MTPKPVVCVGAAIIDDSFFCMDKPAHGTSNPATHHRSAGGVARNVAHHLAQLGDRVELIAHFGNDTDGQWLKEQCSSAGIGLSHSRFSSAGTGRFTAIVSPGGELFAGAADAHCEITISYLTEQTALFKTASLVFVDCNLSVSCLEWLLEFCRTQSVPCVIDPVSVAKASRLSAVSLEDVLLITPNRAELSALSGNPAAGNTDSSIEHLLKKGVQKIWIRKGKEGSEFFSREETIKLPAPDVEVMDTTGAGDAALAGWIHAWLQDKSARECLLYGHAMAAMILQTRGTQSSQLSAELLESKAAHRRTR